MTCARQPPYAYRILEILSGRQGRFCPWEDLAGSLGVHPKEISQAVTALQRLGYPVEVHPTRGVHLRTGIEVVDRAAVANALQTRALGRALVWRLETASTNNLARVAALAGAPHGTVIVAEHQTAGRGRLGRAWHSPPGVGLWCSVLLRPGIPARHAWVLTLGAAVAAAGAIEDVAGCQVDLKWPNDILFDGKKLAGILTEARVEGNAMSFVVVGIGINVNQDLRDFPTDLRETAVSLKMATGRPQRRTALLPRLLHALEAVYAEPSPERVCRLWKARCSTLGREVRVSIGDERVAGVAEDISQDGELILCQTDGVRRAVSAGDVVLLRK